MNTNNNITDNIQKAFIDVFCLLDSIIALNDFPNEVPFDLKDIAAKAKKIKLGFINAENK